MDDLQWSVAGNSVEEVSRRLEKVAGDTIAEGANLGITFDVAKTEAIWFAPGPKGRRKAASVPARQLRIGAHRVPYNKAATRWLGIWLDSALTLQQHRLVRLKKGKQALARLRHLMTTVGLVPANCRRVQMVVVLASTFYGSELWWDGRAASVEGLQKAILNPATRT